MLEASGEPIAILYGLSVLDPVNQIGFTVMQDAVARPDRFDEGASELKGIAEEARSNPQIVVELDERTELLERISGSRDGTLSPLAVAEFAWRDAALALARSDTGRNREVAKATYTRSAESFRDYLDGVRDSAQSIVEILLTTFDASSRILSHPHVAVPFGAKPLSPRWVVDEDMDFGAASTLAAMTDELEPEPFGRLSPYELQVLKRLSVRRRRALQLFLDGALDPDEDPSAVIDWTQSLDEFRLASVARALRGQRSTEPEVHENGGARIDLGFLSSKVREFIADCAAGGT